MNKEFSQTYEFRAVQVDGVEVIVRSTYPGGTDIWGVGELIVNFLRAAGYVDGTIAQIMNLDEISA